MRLHTLTLQAFGPFAGHEHIDFDALDHGILLVNGPTGSGKSSILDAVTFALFGDVAGARRTLKQSLRSHHAPPERDPYVELTFSIGTTRWQVRRVPQWEAPKRRGSGTTTRHASVQLSQWREGGWQLVSARIDEAATTITDTLGMDLDQFAQVVLLPQGEFADFLRARPENRRSLLERLFDVDRFDRIEQWFTEERQRRIRRRDASWAGIEAHFAVVADAVGRLDLPEETKPEWAALPMTDVPETLRVLLRDVRAHRDTADRHSQEMVEAFTSAEHALERSSILERARQTFADAQNALAAWPEAALDRMAHDIEAASAVADVLDRARRRDALVEELTAARVQVTEATTALEHRTGRRDLTEAAIDTVLPVEDLDERAAQLRELLHILGTLEGQLQEQEAARLTQSVTADKLAAAAEAVTAAEDVAATRRAQRDHAAAALAARPDLGSVARDLAATLEDARRAPHFADAVANARARRAVCLSEFADAEGIVLRLRGQRLAGMAAELARDLADGQDCPVCGSTEHPRLACRDEDAPSDEHIATAETRVRTADAARIDSETALAAARAAQVAHAEALQDRLDTLTAAAPDVVPALGADDLGTDLSPLETAATEAAQLMQEHAARTVAAASAEAALSAAVDALRAAQAHHDSAQVRHEATSGAVEAIQERVTATTTEVRTRASRLNLTSVLEPAGLADIPAVAHAQSVVESVRADHAALMAEVRSLSRAQTLAADLEARCTAADEDLSAALARAGYDDPIAAETVALSETELAQLRNTWRTALEIRAAANTHLTDPEIVAAAWTPEANQERLQQRRDLLRGYADRGRAEAAVWESAYQTVSALSEQLSDAVRLHLPLEQSTRELQELANTFTGIGENTHRMRLTSYVLAAHLETVTAMANERLARMTDGRYQLQYTDERAKGNQRSGLGLLVVDAWTGRGRDTATLSGGEAFMASLALALGLGDAVRADSGGMELHTLFVDEGFGSLDQDTLEQVMGVLDDLREGGRLVGVVSHVSELRARIPTRIEVRKTSEGSTIHTTSTQMAGSDPH